MRGIFFSFPLVLATLAAQAQQTDPDQLLKNAIAEQQQGDFQSAIRDYRTVLKLRPNMVEAKVNLGAALVRVGQFDEAITMYRSALPSLSAKDPVLMNLGLAYYKKGDFANAREQFETVHKAEPTDARVAILLGDTYVRLKKPEAAVEILKTLEAANERNLDFQYVFGLALISAGQRRAGVPHIEKVAQHGNSADAYLLAGTTLLQLNDYEKARPDLEAALRMNPKFPNIYTLVGTVRDKTGDAQQAEPAFREALKINPDDFDANLYLGAILYKRRQMDEAKTYLDAAIKLNPTNNLARYEAAMLKSTNGQYEEALQELQSVVKEDPNWLDPHVELASLYYKLHRPEEGAKERAIVERLTAEQQARGPAK